MSPSVLPASSTALALTPTGDRQLANPPPRELAVRRIDKVLDLVEFSRHDRAMMPADRLMRGIATVPVSSALAVAAAGAGATAAGCAALSALAFGAGATSAVTFNTAGAIFFGGTSLCLASTSVFAGGVAAYAAAASALLSGQAANDVLQGGWHTYRGPVPSRRAEEGRSAIEQAPAVAVVEEVD